MRHRQEMLLLFVLLLHSAGLSCAMTIVQTLPGGGWITVSLSNLTNPGGVLSNTGEACDRNTECDPVVGVSVGSFSRSSDLLHAKTEIWKNQNNLPFVFFNHSFVMNESLPTQLHLLIEVQDDNIDGYKDIATFNHAVQLQQLSNATTEVQLYSTPKNRLVSITLRVTITCFEFYYGPTCSKFCREALTGLAGCDRDGKRRCLDGSVDCFRVRERTSAADSMSDSNYKNLQIIYWVIPAVGGAMLLTVLIALTVRLAKSRRTTKIIISQETGGTPGSQSPAALSSTSSASSSDARNYRNPVYSSLKRQCAAAYNRSCSVTTQSSTVTSGDDYEDLDAAAPPDGIGVQSGRPLPEPGIYQ